MNVGYGLIVDMELYLDGNYCKECFIEDNEELGFLDTLDALELSVVSRFADDGYEGLTVDFEDLDSTTWSGILVLEYNDNSWTFPITPLQEGVRIC